MSKNKFKFTTEWQYDLLAFTVNDRYGYKALELYDDSYFTLTEHALIAFTIKRFFKKRNKVPGKVALIEELRQVFRLKEFINSLTREDEEEIVNMCKSLFKYTVKDGDDLLDKTEKFAQYVDLKDVTESVDLVDFGQYEAFSRKVQKAISPRVMQRENKGTFLIEDIKERQFKRQDESPVFPTPFKQLNNLTNAGGYAKGGIIVILDKPKKFKTGMLITIARGYLRRKKKVLYIDLENGEDEISIRMEQSIANRTKKEILSGDHDEYTQRVLRKYKRLGGEMVVKRMPSMVTTMNDVEAYMDYLYREFNFRPDILMIDYAALCGSISGKKDDNERISDVYLDIANLALKKDIIHVYTAMHVKRDLPVQKRERTKYNSNDIAKCIDIIRHVQAIFGLNRSEAEEQAGFMRMEVVEQRDGVPTGRVVFQADIERQRADELTAAQRRAYDEQFSTIMEEPNKVDRINLPSDI